MPEMNFCSNCGSENMHRKVPEGDNRERWVCGKCETIYYTNPRIVAGCLPVFGSKVLLCKRAIPPRKGFWNLPAGYLEIGETVKEGALRELKEEANATMEVIRLHCVYDLPHTAQVYLHFLGEMKTPEFSPGPESLEVRLFEEEEIPWEELAFSSTVFALQKYFKDRETLEKSAYLGQKSYD